MIDQKSHLTDDPAGLDDLADRSADVDLDGALDDGEEVARLITGFEQRSSTCIELAGGPVRCGTG